MGAEPHVVETENRISYLQRMGVLADGLDHTRKIGSGDRPLGFEESHEQAHNPGLGPQDRTISSPARRSTLLMKLRA